MKNIKSKRLDQFPEYVFSELGRKVAEVEKKSGRKVMNFGIGTPDVKPSKKYIDKLFEFFQDPHAHYYPGFKAIPEFEKALIAWYQKRFDVKLSENELMPLLGAKDGISHLPLAIVDPGDEVLVPDPGYPGFSGPMSMLGGVNIFYDIVEKNNFKINFSEIEKKISPKTKFMWVNFPSNPTGAVINLKELEKIVAFAKENNLFIVYDNAYSEITFDGFVAPSILQIDGAKDLAIEIGSFSKSFSFAGFRMGWIVGNKEVISYIAKVKSQMDSGMTLPLQKLGAYALENQDLEWHEEMIKSYKDRREIIAKYLKTLGLEFDLPKGGLYIWAKIPKGKKSYEYSMELLETKQILLTPGTAFGKNGEGYLRVSICVNIEGIEKYFV